MTTPSRATRPARPVRPGRPGRPSALRWRWTSSLRRGISTENRIVAALIAVSLLLTVLVVAFPEQATITSLTIPLFLGSILLSPRTLPAFVVFLMVLLTISVTQQVSFTSGTVSAILVQFVLALLVLLTGFRRARLGVAGLRGESMFVDLRDRIMSGSGIPALPEGWVVESALHSAGGTAFAGDFVKASLSADRTHLQLVVVDVSGKGEAAGTRALLLSGALAGLLAALPADAFLPAANDYLLRQDWEEGFATAVHLDLDLGTGRFEVRTAGHPPAVLRAAGTGRWGVLTTHGPVLGLIPDAEFTGASGSLVPGDAVLLYTDGMVEERSRDIELGIDRMTGQAERLLRGTFVGSAERLVAAVGAHDDDRAVLVVHRSW